MLSSLTPYAPVRAVSPAGQASPNEIEISPAMAALSMASAGVCAYHGYKRNNSVGWAVGWAIMGGMFPVIAPAIALAQGFGKPERRGSAGRSRR